MPSVSSVDIMAWCVSVFFATFFDLLFFIRNTGLKDVVVHDVLCKIINDFHISCFVFNYTTQEDTVSHLSDNITNTQRLFTAGSDTGSMQVTWSCG